MQFPTLLVHTQTSTNQVPASVIPFAKLENNPDILTVEPLEGKSSISIDQVHELQTQLPYKPVKEMYKIALIYQAHLLTLPAQQALLKTLEEPPENTQIILTTHLPNKLLPTILSRCTITRIDIDKRRQSEKLGTDQMYTTLTTQKISDCIHLSDEWSKTRETALLQLQSLLIEIRSMTHTSQSSTLLADERAVVTCIEQLEKNVNVKLALDHLLFALAHTI